LLLWLQFSQAIDRFLFVESAVLQHTVDCVELVVGKHFLNLFDFVSHFLRQASGNDVIDSLALRNLKRKSRVLSIVTLSSEQSCVVESFVHRLLVVALLSLLFVLVFVLMSSILRAISSILSIALWLIATCIARPSSKRILFGISLRLCVIVRNSFVVNCSAHLVRLLETTVLQLQQKEEENSEAMQAQRNRVHKCAKQQRWWCC